MMKNPLVMLLALLVSTSTVLAESDTFTLDESYSIESDGTLFLYSNDAEVTITGENRSDVEVHVFREVTTSGLVFESRRSRFSVEVTEENGNLYIREAEESGSHWGIVGSMHEDYEINIRIPSSVALKIRGDDDDYVIRDISGDLSLRFEDGTARIAGCSSSQLELEAEDGDIDLMGGQGELFLYVEDGEAIVTDGQFSSIEAGAEDGDISIETSLADDGHYDFETDDGMIELTVLDGGGLFVVNVDDGRVRSSRDFDRTKDDEHRIELSLPGGNARVRIDLEDGIVRLRAK